MFTDYNTARAAHMKALRHTLTPDEINRVFGEEFSAIEQLSEVDRTAARDAYNALSDYKKDLFHAWYDDRSDFEESFALFFIHDLGIEYRQHYVSYVEVHGTDEPSVAEREIHGNADERMIASFPMDYQLEPELARELAVTRAQLFMSMLPSPTGTVEGDIEAIRAQIERIDKAIDFTDDFNAYAGGPDSE